MKMRWQLLTRKLLGKFEMQNNHKNLAVGRETDKKDYLKYFCIYHKPTETRL